MSPFFVRKSDDNSVIYFFMFFQDSFNLSSEDILATSDDHITASVFEIKIPFIIYVSDVTHTAKAIFITFQRGYILIYNFWFVRSPGHENLPGFADWKIVTFAVADRNFSAWHSTYTTLVSQPLIASDRCHTDTFCHRVNLIDLFWGKNVKPLPF